MASLSSCELTKLSKVAKHLLPSTCSISSSPSSSFSTSTNTGQLPEHLKNLNVTIAGGGHAAHILVGMLHESLPSASQLNLFAPFKDEAEKWTKSPGVVVNMRGERDLPLAKPNIASKDPALVIPQADLVIMPIPSFAIEPTLRKIIPHLKKNCYLGAVPGNGGFHMTAQRLVHEEAGRRDVVLWGTNQLPLNCRFTKYAEKATCLTTKDAVKLATVPEEGVTTVATVLNTLLSPIHFSRVHHVLTLNLSCSNNVIHSGRLYNLFHEWGPNGTNPSFAENPTFYESMDESTMKCMQDVSDDLRAIVTRLSELTKDPTYLEDWNDIYNAMKEYYKSSISDDSKLLYCFTKNSGYTGLLTPMKQLDNKRWVPDFTSRYFVEDIPYGLCMAKGIAEILNVETPTIDKYIVWAQANFGKEYVVNGRLIGKDMHETAAPQTFGIYDLESLLAGVAKSPKSKL
mmetsp:Transcript_5881/g.9112  ORF Transcript_5881/g.9112 Transcript_5881/m.9112 type:complete len:457 (+) Transcript_5881:65-1435(+)|eukprot:CAMPEP_0201550176 /NCGR_PEP_ID=MMETSP0173_2-20130828/6574_1 /ASSEMBLY_ACC=CAM_ASM_000268 /TAXON_ID=218659 /ORGANISM="Vexillifera sp., Strain DIVA3 564/2" /LENGTH=456 /DNA_ID=CAMNT_0047960083 /DNA_START=10 /DNA_END=1380 /DNA_ORIENTATION=+